MRNFITYEWFTIATIIGLFAIVAAKFINTLRFNDFLYVVGNSKYLKIYSKDQKFVDLFDSLLFINLTLSLSIFVCFAYSTFVTPFEFELASFLKIIIAVAAVVIIKTLVERLIGSLFEIDNLIDDYLFEKTTFVNYSGLVFLASNLFLLYTDISSKIIIISTLVIVFIINLIGFLTSFKNYQKLINPNFFYFLLYLCALEIGPYVLLYKVIREYNT
ncbi:DUF4271 domain-containing protein [Winogradskyella sp. SYSU M77433]|uniref:DUF4271 domain-containing protein n=1 Tax=Winogradskyella sp. SYSU M77433 TaxID=3042722 RepID=UPI00248123F6|nr:DUF4271 domain-containing protein [Winogradskyella sp. SYSU M77433]MDH7912119.1 DUF4271 domain-containing protein [Winogradskyella sp. SYSU M77433]